MVLICAKKDSSKRVLFCIMFPRFSENNDTVKQVEFYGLLICMLITGLLILSYSADSYCLLHVLLKFFFSIFFSCTLIQYVTCVIKGHVLSDWIQRSQSVWAQEQRNLSMFAFFPSEKFDVAMEIETSLSGILF